jgi:hypothetical protein
MPRLGAAVLAAGLVLTGCDALAGVIAGPPKGPEPCGQRFNAVRCLVMTDKEAMQLQTTREDIVSLMIVPDPTPEVRDGVTILQTRSGGPPIDLIVTLADGTITQTTLMCVGVNQEPACVDDPHLTATSVTQGGYHDTPEGASPVPSAAPDDLAMATALRIDRLDIPIDHTGLHEVVLGEAWLPNGLLTSAEFTLVDVWPSDVTILDGGVRLEVRSMTSGQPIQNIYEHGWREGIEGVEAVLVFDVFRFEPGAKLSIQDVVVN